MMCGAQNNDTYLRGLKVAEHQKQLDQEQMAKQFKVKLGEKDEEIENLQCIVAELQCQLASQNLEKDVTNSKEIVEANVANTDQSNERDTVDTAPGELG
jgi:hypothetical protein